VAEIKATDNYIEKYLPFKFLNQIHDLGKETFSLRQYGKMVTFLDHKLEDLEEIVRQDDGKASFDKKMYYKPELDLEKALPLNKGEFHEDTHMPLVHDVDG